MKILITIPHFHDANPGSKYGSGYMTRIQRAGILEATLLGLFDLYLGASGLIDWRGGDSPSLLGANLDASVSIDVVIVTVPERHVLGCLDPLIVARVQHAVAPIDQPKLLGFVARDLLGRSQGYDWYGYMEDDTLLVDRWMFHKLAQATPRPEVVVLPNRFEIDPARPNRKVYTDGPFFFDGTPDFARLVLGTGSFERQVGGVPARFRQVRNAHSGCFFLSAEQMAIFAASDGFREVTGKYVGPLESAATLGLLRTFEVHKPDRANADILEVRHLGGTVLKRLGL
ncbi:MAG: hypothetical protein HQL40_05310 [Alphaproteobacteria bacterium]|nr:hypothetical protein [Alphaproteobacteria bacterium]